MAQDRFSKFKILRHDLSKRVPLHVQLDPCGVCNHNCSFCFSNPSAMNTGNPIKDAKQFPFLDFEIIVRLLDDLAALGTKAITLVGGGEPLLHKRIREILAEIAKRKIMFGVITNLTVNGGLPELARASWVRVSADAATPETYAMMHGAPLQDFDLMLANLRRLAPHAEVGVQVLITSENYKEIPAAAALYRDAGAAYVEFKPPLVPQAGGQLDELAPEILSLVKKAMALQTEHFRVHEQISLIWKYRETLRPHWCRITRYTAAVGCDGLVYPCCITKYIERFTVGDLHKESFADIWKRVVLQPPLDIEHCPPCFYDDVNKVLNYLKTPDSPHDLFI